ncbi:NUDIX hydrolase [Thalassobacillus hwangdonensis]|uniref:NUDIX hydrolase n=1 Tax=Thalassobacillus hwangdonensis TaxID=546108 RepID=A0ABW3L3D8_9BACI
MNFESIVAKLSEHEPKVLGSEHFRKFAILLPLIEKDGEIHVLFEVRAHHMRRQPGEICFPGGKIDAADSTARAAAIRETEEELGISADELSNVHALDYLISPFGMIIYPYAGFLHQTDIERNPAEVSEVFTVPLSFFMENEPDIHHVQFEAKPDPDFPLDLIPGGENYNWQARRIEEYFYIYGDKVIWGLTARVLSHFIDLLKK